MNSIIKNIKIIFIAMVLCLSGAVTTSCAEPEFPTLKAKYAALLEVSESLVGDALKSAAKKAYLVAALKWHPDKNKAPEAEAEFKKINAANEYFQADQAEQNKLEAEYTWARIRATPKPSHGHTNSSGNFGFQPRQQARSSRPFNTYSNAGSYSQRSYGYQDFENTDGGFFPRKGTQQSYYNNHNANSPRYTPITAEEKKIQMILLSCITGIRLIPIYKNYKDSKLKAELERIASLKIPDAEKAAMIKRAEFYKYLPTLFELGLLGATAGGVYAYHNGNKIAG